MNATQAGGWEAPAPRAARARRVLAVAGVAAVAAAVAAALGVDGDDDLVVATPTAPADEGEFGVAEPLPAGPLAPRTEPVGAWTGAELILWGGMEPGPTAATDVVGVSDLLRVDGAAFAPATGTWRELPPAPLEPRLHPAAAWAGDRLLVWGGAGAGFRPLDDGAAYLPDEDRWEPLPGAPLEEHMPWAGVWSGEEFLVVGPTVPDESGDLVGGAAFDPDAGAWRTLPPPPVQFEAFPAATWTGDRLVLWRGARGAVYTPEQDRWELVELPEVARAPGPTFVTTLGQDRIAVFGVRLLGARDASGAVYDLDDDAVEPIATGAPTWLGNARLVAAGDHVLLLPDGLTPDERTRPDALAWDRRSRWRALPDLVGDRSGYASVWTGEEVLVWGGLDGTTAHDDGVRWRPPSP